MDNQTQLTDTEAEILLHLMRNNEAALLQATVEMVPDRSPRVYMDTVSKLREKLEIILVG
jgi:hypothetical protein